jgi:hypothetical protein
MWSVKFYGDPEELGSYPTSLILSVFFTACIILEGMSPWCHLFAASHLRRLQCNYSSYIVFGNSPNGCLYLSSALCWHWRALSAPLRLVRTQLHQRCTPLHILYKTSRAKSWLHGQSEPPTMSLLPRPSCIISHSSGLMPIKRTLLASTTPRGTEY